MSFTAEVKDELSRVPATCTHCDKATLAALVRIEGTLFVSGPGRYRVEVATDVGKCIKLSKEKAQISEELAALYETWEELAED